MMKKACCKQNRRIYLDYAATTPCDPQVVEAMRPYFSKIFGNPSTLYSFGLEARSAMREARKEIAEFLGASPEEIIFTSGGTESNNTVLKGVAHAGRNKGNHIVTSGIEHHSVSESCKFLEKQGVKV